MLVLRFRAVNENIAETSDNFEWQQANKQVFLKNSEQYKGRGASRLCTRLFSKNYLPNHDLDRAFDSNCNLRQLQ
jgi:hypothetical protein